MNIDDKINRIGCILWVASIVAFAFSLPYVGLCLFGTCFLLGVVWLFVGSHLAIKGMREAVEEERKRSDDRAGAEGAGQ